jgi:hypothetical protein
MPSEYSNPITQARTETHACPHITPNDANRYADQAIRDALGLLLYLLHLHTLDPQRWSTAA